MPAQPSNTRDGQLSGHRGLLMARSFAFLAVLGLLFISMACDYLTADHLPATPRGTFYVSLAGDDATGDGSPGRPWRTIEHAASAVPAAGGFTILVRNGLYDGPTFIRRAFTNEVIVKAEEPYGATLTNVANNDAILSVILDSPNDGPVHITFEGFVFSNEGTSLGPCTQRAGHMVFLSNVSNFTLRNNIIYGNNRRPRCNNMIKANIVGATKPWHDIRFEGNLFGNPPALDGNDLIDIFEPTEFDICDNIFFSDRGGSIGGSFVALRRRWGATTRSPRYHINRNVFLNYEGGSDAAFIRIGGWGDPISDALIENNLMIGNSSTTMAAPVILEDASDITLRANTVVGNLPSSAFAFRLGTYADGPAPVRIFVYNNIFSDPTSTMGELVATFGNGDIGATVFNRNLYWNGDGVAPGTNDPAPLEANPLLATDQSGTIVPVWDVANRRFASGSRTVREEFERLVRTYGAISVGSPASNAAVVDRMPTEDILGLPRDGTPDLGAFEIRP
jgi:hypothetical protein